MRKPLTKKQKEIYDYLQSLDVIILAEVANYFDMKISSLHQHFKLMASKGWLINYKNQQPAWDTIIPIRGRCFFDEDIKKLIIKKKEEAYEECVGKTIVFIRKWMDEHEKQDSSFSTDKLVGNLMKELL